MPYLEAQRPHLHHSDDEVMETCLALLDEVGVKVVSQDAFPWQLEPHLWELLLEFLVEVMELIVPVREGREGRGRGGHDTGQGG